MLVDDKKFKTFGDDPREEVMTLERILLQTIKFDLQVDHPYSFLLKYAKSLKGNRSDIQCRIICISHLFLTESRKTNTIFTLF
jgi:Cdk activating kinase (CAK)/RNA polymerase II transcription initiation/nucleotide excision repair factor TFIIH/TFIIK, cyclin H subunit